MPRLSKIDRLPDVCSKIAELRGAGLTGDQIMTEVRNAFPNLPADALPARSGFLRQIRKVDERAAETRKRLETVVALSPRVGDLAPQLRRIIETLLVAVADLINRSDSGQIDPSTLHKLAQTMNLAATAVKTMGAASPNEPPALPPDTRLPVESSSAEPEIPTQSSIGDSIVEQARHHMGLPR